MIDRSSSSSEPATLATDEIWNPVTLMRHMDKSTLVWNAFLVYLAFSALQMVVKIVYLELGRRYVNAFYEKQGVAAPAAHPLWGLLLDRMRPENANRLNLWRLEKLRSVPDSSRVVLWKTMILNERPLLWTMDPEVTKHILVDAFDKYTKTFYKLENPGDEFFVEWLGTGIFAAPHGSYSPDAGANWYFQRKHASLMFTRNNFRKTMCQTFVKKAHILCDVIRRGGGETRAPESLRSKSNQAHALVMDFQSLMFRFTMDSVLALFFGVNTNTLEGKMDEYATGFDKVQVEAMNYLGKELPKMFLSKALPYPFSGPGGLCNRYLQWRSPHARAMRHWINVMQQYSTKIIEDRRKELNVQTDKEAVDNMLSFFMSATDDGEALDKLPHLGLHEESAKTKFLSDVILSLVLAGRDTTATLLTWALFELSTRPEVQQKLFEEVERHLPNQTDPQFDDVYGPGMDYLNGVVYETLRMWPAVPLDQKTAMEDDVLPDGTKVLKGTVVNFFIFGMGRETKLWGPDAEEFKPERWIPFKLPEGGIWPVFQLGPRRCLGEQMALMEAKIVLIMMIQRFRFSILPGQKELIRTSNNITLSLSNSPTLDSFNLWLSVEERQ